MKIITFNTAYSISLKIEANYEEVNIVFPVDKSHRFKIYSTISQAEISMTLPESSQVCFQRVPGEVSHRISCVFV